MLYVSNTTQRSHNHACAKETQLNYPAHKSTIRTDYGVDESHRFFLKMQLKIQKCKMVASHYNKRFIYKN